MRTKDFMRRGDGSAKVPRSVQEAIPVEAVYPDGIFRVGRERYSRCYRFTDINYAVAGDADKERMLEGYAAILNSLDLAATTKITIHNRKRDWVRFEDEVLLKKRGDGLDGQRREYNRILTEKARQGNGLVQEKYVTVTVDKRSVEEARSYFARTGAELSARFRAVGSVLTEMDTDERLKILHDFYRAGEEQWYRFDLKDAMRKGHDFRDGICPDTLEFRSGYFRMGERYGRVLYLKEYASVLEEVLLTELGELRQNLMLSLDILPVSASEAVREAENLLLGIETNIAGWQRRQNRNNNFAAMVPYDLQQQREEMREYLDDLTVRDQRQLLTVLTLVHTADTLEQLDRDTRAIQDVAGNRFCTFSVLRYQQAEGLNTALPVGVRRIDALRTLTTGSAVALLPFRVQEIEHRGGVYYGQNLLSRNMILADRHRLLNGNAFILGVSGSGKSFAAKQEILSEMLATDADILIVDPENEYGALTRALGGETVRIAASSPHHLNAMDLNPDYADGADPVVLKSEFLLSLFELLMEGQRPGPMEKSILDRCAANVYRDYLRRGCTGPVPTLKGFREELLRQPEREAASLALALELFARGSLDTFAYPTNVDVRSRLVCFDIRELGPQLMPVGMLVVLDAILNRITANRAAGKKTFVYLDEIYLLFRQEHSANFLYTMWKRVRKYGACLTGVTQNVTDLLESHTARAMLANSEFILMLNQAAVDLTELSDLFGISETQAGFIRGTPAGTGLLKIGSALIPFEDRFPKESPLYGLMSTGPEENRPDAP